MLVTIIHGKEFFDGYGVKVVAYIKLPSIEEYTIISPYMRVGPTRFQTRIAGVSYADRFSTQTISTQEINFLSVDRFPAISTHDRNGAWVKYGMDVPENTRFRINISRIYPDSRDHGIFELVSHPDGAALSIDIPFTGYQGANLKREFIEGSFYRHLPKFNGDIPENEIYKYFMLDERNIAHFTTIENEKKPIVLVKKESLTTLSGKKVKIMRKAKRSLNL